MGSFSMAEAPLGRVLTGSLEAGPNRSEDGLEDANPRLLRISFVSIQDPRQPLPMNGVVAKFCVERESCTIGIDVVDHPERP